MTSSLVSGKKDKLLGEFKRLKPLHGSKWRGLLKAFNKWHNTTEGLYAWQNACRGTVGNEALRQIVADMKKIEAKQKGLEETVLSPKKLESVRQASIEQSIKNLGHKSKVKKSA